MSSKTKSPSEVSRQSEQDLALKIHQAMELLRAGRADEAIDAFAALHQIQPRSVKVLSGLGMALRSAGRLQEAEDVFQQALVIKPDQDTLHANLGNVLADQDRFADAVHSYRKAIGLHPDRAQSHAALGGVLHDLGEYAHAEAAYRRSLELEPAQPGAHLGLALSLLTMGRWNEAWDHYEQRLEAANSNTISSRFSCPRWDGKAMPQGRVLLWGEQGVGDEIMFSGFLPQILGQGIKAGLECDRRLVSLFSRTFPDVEVIPRRQPPMPEALAEDFRAQAATGSLPGLLGVQPRDNETIFQPWLQPDAARVAQLQERYRQNSSGCLVGISWRSGNARRGPKRSIPLQAWAPLLQCPGLRFVSLQYGSTAEELNRVQKQLGVDILHDASTDPMEDLDGFAAQVAAMDLVISVDNSTVHFAGALGIPCWVLLSFVPDWRWLTETSRSCWYSAVRLYRQGLPGVWAPVLQTVCKDLQAFARDGRALPETSDDERGVYFPPAEQARPRTGTDLREFERSSPSRAFLELAEMYRHMHCDGYAMEEQSGKERLEAKEAFPGNELPRFAPYIKVLVARHKARSILDYGAGKGHQYDPRPMTDHLGQTFPDIRSYWGVDEIVCYDPGVEEFSVLPDRQLDGVVSTDVLEHCSEPDVPWIVEEMFAHARKFVFANIACYPAHARLPDGRNAHITVQSPDWWIGLFEVTANRFRGVDYQICMVTARPHDGGYLLKMHTACRTGWLAEEVLS